MQIVTNTARHLTWSDIYYIYKTRYTSPPKLLYKARVKPTPVSSFPPEILHHVTLQLQTCFSPDRPTLPIGAANVTRSRESPVLKQSVTVRLSRPAVLRALWDDTHILCDTPPAVPAAPLPDSFSCRSTLKACLCPPAPYIP